MNQNCKLYAYFRPDNRTLRNKAMSFVVIKLLKILSTYSKIYSKYSISVNGKKYGLAKNRL